jgi:hypothetical protein
MLLAALWRSRLRCVPHSSEPQWYFEIATTASVSAPSTAAKRRSWLPARLLAALPARLLLLLLLLSWAPRRPRAGRLFIRYLMACRRPGLMARLSITASVSRDC